MYKLAIFDLDGTLINSISDACKCFNLALSTHGQPTHTVEQFSSMVGGDLEQMVSRLLQKPLRQDTDLINAIKEEYKRVYSCDSKEDTKPYSGVIEMLSKLNAKSIKVGINTNKNHHLTIALVDKLFLSVKVDSVIGSGGDVASKPNPEAVRLMQAKYNVNNSDTVYIGDTMSDIDTARNADIDCIYVTWGQGKPTDLNSYERMKVVDTVEELLAAII